MKKYLFLLFLFVTTPLYAQVDLQEGLISYYPFGGNADDYSGNGNHGVVNGPTLTEDRVGNIGNAFKFDGNDDVIDFGISLSDITLPFSFSIWVNRPAGSGLREVFSSNDNAFAYFGFFMSLNETETLAMSFGDGGIPGESSRRSVESSIELPADEWVHVVAVMRNADDMSMYFNGNDTKGFLHGTGGSEMINAEFPARLGLYNLGVNGVPWIGAIDDIRIYDRALSVAEVQALFELEPDNIKPDPTVIVSEIMKNPEDVTDSVGEWFELFNITDEAIDLNGWKIMDLGTESHTINQELVINPHQTLVLCKIADPALNGDVPCDYQYTSVALDNKEDEIILVDADGVEIDRVTYDNGVTFPSPEGASLFYNAGPEDDNNDGGNWEASFERAANFGNSACPICDDFGSPGTVDSGTLPVEMTGFSVVMDGETASLRWETASEENNAGFEIYHRAGNNGFQQVGWIAGAGTTTEQQRYTFKTDRLAPGRHSFRIRQIDFDGTFSWSQEVEQVVALNKPYEISAPYPNPYNPTTNLTFSVQQSQHVIVEMVNLVGQRVALPFDASAAANTVYDVRIAGGNLPSGRYFIRVRGEQFAETYQVYLVK